MRYERIRAAGRVMRALQTHQLSALTSPREHIRVTYTHEVLKEDEGNFEKVVDYLTEKYQALTPCEFFQIMKEKQPLRGRSFLMTFDDGLMSSYWAIKNILSKFNIKAIVFYPTQILELKTVQDMKRFTWQNIGFHKGEEAPPSLREETYLMMGPKELLDLVKDGHEIFPHTHSHKRLMEITDDTTAQEELVKPKRILENLLQRPMNAFAFPVGTERVVSHFSFPYVKREYEFCFSALPGKTTLKNHPHLLHRDCLNAYYDLMHVRNLADGVFDLYYSYRLSKLKQAFQA